MPAPRIVHLSLGMALFSNQLAIRGCLSSIGHNCFWSWQPRIDFRLIKFFSGIIDHSRIASSAGLKCSSWNQNGDRSCLKTNRRHVIPMLIDQLRIKRPVPMQFRLAISGKQQSRLHTEPTVFQPALRLFVDRLASTACFYPKHGRRSK